MTSLIFQSNIKTANDLKMAADALEKALSNNLPMLNGDVVVLMTFDSIIREAAINAGMQGLDDQYFKNNLSSFLGETVLEKNYTFIRFLKSLGEDKTYEHSEYPLRNFKHVFDNVSDDIIEAVLPKINEELGCWLRRR